MQFARNQNSARLGKVSPALSFVVASVVVVGALILLIFNSQKPSTPMNTGTPLVVFCAAGVRPPVEEVARAYEKEYGVQVQLNYGGSQTLYSGLQVSKQGDLYLPGDDSYIRAAQKEGLAAEAIPLSKMSAVICVKKGNPKNIRTIADLTRPDTKLAQANPDAAAIGKLTRKVLTKTGNWTKINDSTHVFKGTVNEVVNAVKLGAVDAGIAWDAVVAQQDDLEFVRLEELTPAAANIAITVLNSTTQPTAALRFARYLASSDKGLPAFAKLGYTPEEGDTWSESPTLNLYSGAMLRPAIEQTIKEFEEREGVRISSKFNGCGILVAAMRTGERPDAYFSCETSFMTQVEDFFLESEDISQNRLVILTAKGNPKKLNSLADLGQEGIKLGLAHEEQSALGALTKIVLKENNVYDPVRKNVVVESPTGDFLVNQIITGSLDAVIVYFSNANAARDKIDIVSFESEGALAVQPVAVGKQSNHKQLAARLIEAIKTAESKDRFLANGFKWEWTPKPAQDEK